MFIMLNYLIMVKAMGNLTNKQEAFALKYAECGNASESYRHAYNTEKMKPETISRMAHDVVRNHKVAARIDELRGAVRKEAEEELKISKIQRLKWLRDIVEAGLSVYVDGNASQRREGLSAARSAIVTMNEMLDKEDTAEKVDNEFIIRVIDGNYSDKTAK